MELCSNGYLLSLNPMQSFKFKCLTWYLSTDTSNQKHVPHTQPSAGHFFLIIWQQKNLDVYLYWVLHIIGRVVRGRKNYTSVKLRINSTWIPFFEGLCVRLSPADSSVAILGTLYDTGITHAFNSILLLMADIRTI